MKGEWEGKGRGSEMMQGSRVYRHRMPTLHIRMVAWRCTSHHIEHANTLAASH